MSVLANGWSMFASTASTAFASGAQMAAAASESLSQKLTETAKDPNLGRNVNLFVSSIGNKVLCIIIIISYIKNMIQICSFCILISWNMRLFFQFIEFQY